VVHIPRISWRSRASGGIAGWGGVAAGSMDWGADMRTSSDRTAHSATCRARSLLEDAAALAFDGALSHAATMQRRLLASIVAAPFVLCIALLGCGGSLPQASADPSASAASPPSQGAPPVTPQRPVTHIYHGVSVSDPYEWLEGESDEVHAWSRGQNAYTRRLLDALPGRAELGARVRELFLASPDWYVPIWKAGRLFALEDRPPKQQAYLVTMPKPEPSLAATSSLRPALWTNSATIWSVASRSAMRRTGSP